MTLSPTVQAHVGLNLPLRMLCMHEVIGIHLRGFRCWKGNREAEDARQVLGESKP